MSAIDNFLAAQPAAASASAPQGVTDLLARDGAVPSSTPMPVPVAAQASQSNWQPPGGFIMGLGDVIKGGVQSMMHGGAYVANKLAPDAQFTKDLNAAIPQVDTTIANQEHTYQAARTANQAEASAGSPSGQTAAPGVDWPRLGGNLAGAAPMALVAPEAAGLSTPARIAIGSALGAQSSVFQPVTDNTKPYADQKADQIGVGALTGGVAAPLTSTIGAIISGAGDAATRRLAQAGVTMTPGQILGPAAARTEEKLTSVPILGDFIKNAQVRSVESFNRAAYDQALKPIGATLPRDVPIGSDAIAGVRNRIGAVYDSIEPRATFVPDQNFNADVTGIRANLAQTAPAMLPQFNNIVDNQITAKAAASQGALSGAQWGDTRSTISGIARNQRLGNATPDNRSLADALDELNGAVNAGVARSSPPDILPTLQNANAAWARYKQIEAAAGMAGASNNGNVFTAAQFANAVRRGSTAAQKATNSGLNGQFAADATDVLGAKYPNSGTPGRAALMAALGAAGGHAMLPASVSVPATLGGVAAALPYTGIGQRIGQTLLMARPAGAAQVGQAIGNYGVPLSAALGAALVNGTNR